MANQEKFRKLFVEFEHLVLNTTDETPTKEKLWVKVTDLKNKRLNPYYSEYEFLNFCREYRNKLSHEPNENKYLDFNDTLIIKMEDIIHRIKYPYKVLDKATKPVVSADIKDNVREKMKEMLENNYTHIPIYEGKSLIGIFSENCLFNYLLKEEIVEISDNTLFSDIKDYIDLNNSKEVIKFVKRDELYDNVVNDFIDKYNKGEKLSCIMITQNGIKGEYILGIITSWDVIGKK